MRTTGFFDCLPDLRPAKTFLSIIFLTGLTLFGSKDHAMANQDVAATAKSITVLIDSSVSGSGFIAKKVDDTYIVMTSWHVISPNKAGEEILIRTWDGTRHRAIEGSIRQIRDLDLATLKFKSANSYQSAPLGSSREAVEGSITYISGFPLASEYNPYGVLRFVEGKLVSNARSSSIPGGYQLMYSNPTFPGMSGGPLFNSKGEVIGIHGMGETDPRLTKTHGIAVKTGINKAVPIGLLDPSYIPKNLSEFGKQPSDYLARAWNLIFVEKKDFDVAIDLLNKAIPGNSDSVAYFARSIARSNLGRFDLALSDIENAISVDSSKADYHGNKAIIYSRMGRYEEALKGFSDALLLKPDQSYLLANRAEVYRVTGKLNYAMKDVIKSLLLSPNDPNALNIKGAILIDQERYDEALVDLNRAIELMSPASPQLHLNKALAHKALGQNKMYCIGLAASASSGYSHLISYLQRPEQKWCLDIIREFIE